tara:strand:+ start:204 stop:1094 length:891 start_codon:yes stop_codon:yes gene_type:complete
MHITIRYGNESGTPIFHLKESISEGRVSPRGRACQGMLKNRIEDFFLLHPNKKISVDLRANTDQIIAVGVLGKEHWYEHNPLFWSGSKAYKYTWSVEWRQVFQKPMTYKGFCEKYGLSKTEFMEKPIYHAHHGWLSPEVDLTTISTGEIPKDYIDDGFAMILEQNEEIVQYFDTMLQRALPRDKYEKVITNYHNIQTIIEQVRNTGDEVSISNEWETKLNVKGIRKKTKKKKTTSKQKEKAFLNRFRKNVNLAKSQGIEGNYAMATHFTNKRYRTRRGGRKWNGATVGKYREKLGI